MQELKDASDTSNWTKTFTSTASLAASNQARQLVVNSDSSLRMYPGPNPSGIATAATSAPAPCWLLPKPSRMSSRNRIRTRTPIDYRRKVSTTASMRRFQTTCVRQGGPSNDGKTCAFAAEVVTKIAGEPCHRIFIFKISTTLEPHEFHRRMVERFGPTYCVLG
ncbi:hypothetical protein C8F01DRAFT_479958 [Mycena amicta]|nr:hypothetical protein C8F01DRAFT_479958 [Mycena amicta]